ncbi:alpha/beta fold hydrolase [Dactylosporangium matsuzakiense]|uniref:ABC transporter ATP-binding protein n=1 Tax=Dactylosporangium matsuzakiense TaxID=53360 RepID=A0A9W6KAL9_9ACTN|nr:alpha/beta fold hydrolase [Dactylosporangium matsuzakiense]UWZ45421.1 alpha/beta fold hydrolase [Dactylosporangium matsuzakiense]GLK98590.1 ABC transporter ATP-binding protein [Dactylosporangium matsuzakiense]
MRIRLPRLSRRQIIAGAVGFVLVAGLIGWAAAPTPKSYRTTEQMLPVKTGPDDAAEVTLDTTLYLPKSASASSPVPAILLAHGFGGTKRSVDSDARLYAEQGYAVLAWTAQGFGRSTGEIHLDSPDWEVKDAQRLIDWLAGRADIARNGTDPKVAAVGGSYGGALSLLLAAQDSRVDAIVPMITWNDLVNSFLPGGVFKKQWAGQFFGATENPASPQCGRFAADLCRAYLDIATTGKATPAAEALLRKSSPSAVLDRIKAPTLLIQGQVDTLFPLSEGDANARGIAANGTPVRVAWFTGGHDGGTGPQSEVDRLRLLTGQWLDHYLKGNGAAPANSFTYSRVSGLNAQGRGLVTAASKVDSYPGLNTSGPAVGLRGPAQPIANPPDGNPAAISSLPLAAGLSGLLGSSGLAGGLSQEIPGQHADFVSEPLGATLDVAGSPRVQIRVASPTGEATLFVKLYDVPANGSPTIPDGLIAPIRLTGLPKNIADAVPMTVILPAVVHRFEAGSAVRVTIATADTAYWSPSDPAVYTVAVDGAITMPAIAGAPIANPDVVWRYVLAGLIALIVIGLIVAVLVARGRARRVDRSVATDLVDMPLVVRGLRKEYKNFVAVSKVDFTVSRGQVVGLLGPNGAGKTTSLRVLMGLTRPTSGEILVFGHRLLPGAPVLSRVGALVEGPGFLPHLTGAQNLELYWRATGRPRADAHFEEAYDIAGLGTAVHRRVKTYSHGMRQRLAIAQAMLGLPELLVLDEPTDGLDPPQIAEMRKVLRRYATGGRAVLVSSHLLAEVEQTCTDVVVMHKGEVVAAGPVDDIVGDSPSVQLDVSDVDAAEKVLEELDGVRSVSWSGGKGLVVDIDGTPRAEVVAALVRAGVGIDRVTPRRRLEDAFLSLVGGDTKASGERS